MTAPAASHAVLAAGRFGHAARSGELAAIAADPRRWALRQLDSPYQPAAFPARSAAIRPDGGAYAGAASGQGARPAVAKDIASPHPRYLSGRRSRPASRRRRPAPTPFIASGWCISGAIISPFPVSGPSCAASPPALEREAIRPRCDHGPFRRDGARRREPSGDAALSRQCPVGRTGFHGRDPPRQGH